MSRHAPRHESIVAFLHDLGSDYVEFGPLLESQYSSMQHLRTACSKPVDAVQTLEILLKSRSHAFEVVRHAKPDTTYVKR